MEGGSKRQRTEIDGKGQGRPEGKREELCQRRGWSKGWREAGREGGRWDAEKREFETLS